MTLTILLHSGGFIGRIVPIYALEILVGKYLSIGADYMRFYRSFLL